LNPDRVSSWAIPAKGLTMSDRDTSPQSTQHAFLVAWGRFAAEMGLNEQSAFAGKVLRLPGGSCPAPST
jgi:hypothetical protein